MTVWRDHDERTVSVRIAKLQDEDVVASDKTPAEPGVQPVEALGLTLAGLTPDLRQQMGIPDDIDGVVVMAVEDRSPAAEQGLRPGDVIRQVGSESVTRPQQVESLAQAARAENRQALLLLVNRGGNELFVALKVAA